MRKEISIFSDDCSDVFVVAKQSGSFYGTSMTAGDIYIVGGDGTAGYAGDGGPATSAEFNLINGLAVDDVGNILLSDFGNYRVRVIAESTGPYYGQSSMTRGDIYTIAGDGTEGYSGDGGSATSAEINDPTGLAVDSSGDFIWSDKYSYRIREAGGAPMTALTAMQTGIATGDVVRHNPGCTTQGSYPINCASGDFWHSFTDISIPGRGPAIDLERTYNSLDATVEGIFGYGWSSSYEMHLTVNGDGSVTFTAEDGSQVTFEPNGGGSFVGPSWADSTLTNSGSTYTLVRQQTQTFTFNSSGQLTSISDPNGYSTSLSYSSGKLSTVTDPAGRTITFIYGSNGLVSEVSGPDSHNTSYGYDSSGDLTGVTDPNGDVTSFSYSSHLMLTMTLPNGQSGGPDAGHDVVNSYNSAGQILTQTDPAGLETQYSYAGNNFSATGGTTTITDPHGNVEVEDYANGELTSLTKGYGTSAAATWTYTYDPDSLGGTTVTDPNSHTTTNTYDADGNLLTTEDPDGNTTTYTYNSFDEPLTITDPKGIETAYTYDSDGNVLTQAVTGVGGSPTETTYYTYGDGHGGDLTKVVDPDGDITTYTYDSYGDHASTTTYPSSTSTTSPTVPADHFVYSSGISAVGSLATTAGSGITTRSVDPSSAGDLMVLSADEGLTTVHVSSVSGGGVTTWTKAVAFDGSVGNDDELWYGGVTTTAPRPSPSPGRDHLGSRGRVLGPRVHRWAGFRDGVERRSRAPSTTALRRPSPIPA